METIATKSLTIAAATTASDQFPSEIVESQVLITNQDQALQHLIHNVSNKLENYDEKRRNQLEINEIVKNELDYLNLANIKNKNDITMDLKELEFEDGFSQQNGVFTVNNFDYVTVRKKAHIKLVASVAHATYFIAVANKIRHNFFDIKNGIFKQNSNLLTEINKEPGLKIGIIGGGQLGQQLAKSLLDFASVYPNELRISTRQPEFLTDLKSKGVLCFFNNAKLASSVNILFLCVLPAQFPQILEEIKRCLPEKCIIYTFVSGYSEAYLKTLLGETNRCSQYIIKSNIIFNENLNLLLPYWNHTLSVIESLCKSDMMQLINPFYNGKEKAFLKMNEYYKSMFVYAFINICTFMSLTKQETLNVLRVYLFHLPNKTVKMEESSFFNNNQLLPNSDYFQLVNLIDAISDSTPLALKFQKSKAYRVALKNNFTAHFQTSTIWKSKSNI